MTARAHLPDGRLAGIALRVFSLITRLRHRIVRPSAPADASPFLLPPQLNIANPATGQQKKLEITDESKL